MNLEEALINMGDQPLSSSPYFKTIQAVINSLISNPDQQVTPDMPGHRVLGMVYQHPDASLQTRILTRQLGVVRGTDRYRHLVLGFSSILGLLAVGLAGVEVFSEDPVNNGGSQVLIEIIHGFFEVIKLVVGSNAA